MSMYLDVAKYNLRFNLLPHIAAALGLVVLTPVLFGITALDAVTVAYPLEFSLPFLGVILLTPVYTPEQDPGLLDTVRIRKTPYLLICGIRIVMMSILMLLFIGGFVLLMSVLESEVTLAHVWASYANAVFLGGLGILTSAVSGQAVIGYMVPVLYFVMDLMGSFGSFTMFSMMRNGTIDGKVMLFLIGICCIAASAGIRRQGQCLRMKT